MSSRQLFPTRLCYDLICENLAFKSYRAVLLRHFWRRAVAASAYYLPSNVNDALETLQSLLPKPRKSNRSCPATFDVA